MNILESQRRRKIKSKKGTYIERGIGGFKTNIETGSMTMANTFRKKKNQTYTSLYSIATIFPQA